LYAASNSAENLATPARPKKDFAGAKACAPTRERAIIVERSIITCINNCANLWTVIIHVKQEASSGAAASAEIAKKSIFADDSRRQSEDQSSVVVVSIVVVLKNARIT
jgi:hypothetical protein